MAAPKGNEYYKLAKGQFKRPVVYTPEALEDKFNEFLESWGSRRIHIKEVIKGGHKAGDIVSVPTQVAMTILSFCLFAKISSQTFYEYKKKEEYRSICTHIEESTREQMMLGAMSGTYKENIVARILGLWDKQEVKSDTNITFNEEKTYEGNTIKEEKASKSPAKSKGRRK